MSHYKLNPPPYVPREPKFIGVPDSKYFSIRTDELEQADEVIRGFGGQGPGQQLYVEDFFNGTTDSPPAPETLQLTDIDEHFPATPEQEQAINHGCAAVRAEFLTGLKIANALSADNLPAPAGFRVGAANAAYVSVAKVGSQYQARCDAFQKGLNAGGHGPK